MPFFVLNLRFLFLMVLQYTWEYFDWNDCLISTQNFAFGIIKREDLDEGKYLDEGNLDRTFLTDWREAFAIGCHGLSCRWQSDTMKLSAFTEIMVHVGLLHIGGLENLRQERAS